jgi:hypothetical protein
MMRTALRGQFPDKQGKNREFCHFDLYFNCLSGPEKAAWLLHFFDEFHTDCNRECRSWIREIKFPDPVLIRDPLC